MKPETNPFQILSAYQPRPGRRFYQRMENAPWKNKAAGRAQPRVRSLRFRWQLAIAVFMLLILLSLGIPAVRAALSAWLGLSVAPSNQIPVGAVTLEALTPPAPASGAALPGSQTAQMPAISPSSNQTQRTAVVAQPAQITALSSKVDWNILTPGDLPADYHFESAYYDQNHKMVVLTYLATRPLPGVTDPNLTATKTITLLEALRNDFVPMQVAPVANIEDVVINGMPAAYAPGAWDTQFIKDDQDPQGGKMVSTWRNDLKIQNLYWQVGNVYLALISDDDTLSRHDLIVIAASTSG
jgi:hypothetical protein